MLLLSMLQGLGAEVSLLYRYDSVLRSFDPMLQSGLLEALDEAGITRVPQATPTALQGEPGNIRVQTKAGDELGPFDCVLWCVGRVPHGDCNT